MKVAINKINLRNTQFYNIDRLTILYIQLGRHVTSNSFLFNTINYDKVINYNHDIHFHDQISDYSGSEVRGIDNLSVLFYDRDTLILCFDDYPSFRPQFCIYLDELDRALEFISRENDYSYLENEALEKLEREELNNELVYDKDLPELTDYISQNSEDFKAVYYPGTAWDFSALQLFGFYADGADVYYTDYMYPPELQRIKKRLDNESNATEILKPETFGKSSWNAYWSDNPEDWNEKFHHPKRAWGRKTNFSVNSNNFNFIYLGTEGVKTCEILMENNVVIDVLVLQDHVLPKFSAADSYLYNTMKSNLPKYILLDPTGGGNTFPWPGYQQVTKPHLPKVYQSLPQSRNPRALFKLSQQ